MNRDDIIRMALEVGFSEYHLRVLDQGIYRLADLVAAAERQRLHDKFMEIHKSQQHSNNYWHFAARKIMEES